MMIVFAAVIKVGKENSFFNGNIDFLSTKNQFEIG